MCIYIYGLGFRVGYTGIFRNMWGCAGMYRVSGIRVHGTCNLEHDPTLDREENR